MTKQSLVPLIAVLLLASPDAYALGEQTPMPPPTITAQPPAEVPAALGPAVTLTPIAGVTVQVPMGWIACDDANNAKLGNAKDEYSLATPICRGPRSGSLITFGAFNPAPYSTAAIFFGFEKDNPIRPEAVEKLTDANIASIETDTCPIVEKPLLAENDAIEGCVLTRESLSGHVGLVFRITFLPPMGEMSRSVCEVWAIPTDHGVIDFNLTWTLLFEKKALPALQAIKASVTIQ